MDVSVTEGGKEELIWKDDLLGRSKDAAFLEMFLTGRMTERRKAGTSGSYVINIDANWGGGKTFFMERFGRQLEKSSHIVARVNAWQDDHLDDPFISILAAIDCALEPYTKKRKAVAAAWRTVKSSAAPIAILALAGIGKTAVEKYVGSHIEDLVGSVEAVGVEELAKGGADGAAAEAEQVADRATQALINRLAKKAALAERFQYRLIKTLEAIEGDKVHLPLFVLVDELDRCRPSYAVALLERIKHLFNADHVVFIFATNNDQLQHSIAGAYGPNFDGRRYLKRFFDKTYSLQEPSIDEYVKAHAGALDPTRVRDPLNNPASFFALLAKHYGLALRDMQHVLDIAATVVSAWPHQTKIDLVALIPLATTYYLEGRCEWNLASAQMPDSALITMQNPRRGKPERFAVKGLFELFNRYSADTKAAIALGEGGNIGVPERYVFESLRPEWEFSQQAMRRSLQRQLPTLIASAGRFELAGNAE